jgi:hypothetical protein
MSPSRLGSWLSSRRGELLKIGKFQIEPILGRHGEPSLEVTRAFNQALRSITTPISPEEAAVAAAIRARGTSDPRIIEEGNPRALLRRESSDYHGYVPPQPPGAASSRRLSELR